MLKVFRSGLNLISLQSKILLLLIFVSFASILVVSLVSYSSGQAALKQTILDNLISTRNQTAREIQTYFQFTESHVLSMGETPLVIDSTKAFKTAYQKLATQQLTQQQQQKLTTFYQKEYLPRLAQNTGSQPVLQGYFPYASAAKYLQYHYIANNPRPLAAKEKLDQGNDGSEYSLVHQRYHRVFRNIADKFGYEDIYLVDIDGNILYTVKKEIDLGTNLKNGPYANSNLAKIFQATLDSRAYNFVSSIDFAPYRPSYDRPVAFIATTVYDGPNFVGALIIKAPISRINRIMTFDGKWRALGLQETGESYLVGQDYRLRSLSRFFVENPEEYYKDLKHDANYQEEIDNIRRMQSPIFIQEVKTIGVQKALSGEKGSGIYQDYRGKQVLGAYQPIKLGSFQWALLTEMDTSESFQPIRNLIFRILATAAILIPLITLLSNYFSSLLVRPIQQLINGIKKIGAGETNVKVNIKSKDEFRQLANSFNEMSDIITTKDQLLKTQIQENEDLLLNLFPPSVAERFKQGTQEIIDTYPNVTVLYAEVDGFDELSGTLGLEKALSLLDELVNTFDEVATQFSVEKVKTIGAAYIAVCGLSEFRVDHTRCVADFALELLKVVYRFNQKHKTYLCLDIGIDSGSVVATVVGKTRSVFELWGDTIDIARDIHSSREHNVIHVTQSVYDSLLNLYMFHPLEDAEVKGRKKIPVWLLMMAMSEF